MKTRSSERVDATNLRLTTPRPHDQENNTPLERAKQLYTDNKVGEALLIVDAACKIQPEDVAGQRQRLVLRIIVDGRNKEYKKVLGADGETTASHIASEYRKLAQQVHPDKCKCFGAEEAFQLINQAASALQSEEEGGFVREQDKAHAWWDKWEEDPGGTKRKRKREGEAQTEDEAELLNMRQCPIEELKKIVASRQKAILRPEKGLAEAKLTASQRQQRLRTARGILNERMAYLNSASARSGGFM